MFPRPILWEIVCRGIQSIRLEVGQYVRLVPSGIEKFRLQVVWPPERMARRGERIPLGY